MIRAGATSATTTPKSTRPILMPSRQRARSALVTTRCRNAHPPASPPSPVVTQGASAMPDSPPATNPFFRTARSTSPLSLKPTLTKPTSPANGTWGLQKSTDLIAMASTPPTDPSPGRSGTMTTATARACPNTRRHGTAMARSSRAMKTAGTSLTSSAKKPFASSRNTQKLPMTRSSLSKTQRTTVQKTRGACGRRSASVLPLLPLPRVPRPAYPT